MYLTVFTPATRSWTKDSVLQLWQAVRWFGGGYHEPVSINVYWFAFRWFAQRSSVHSAAGGCGFIEPPELMHLAEVSGSPALAVVAGLVALISSGALTDCRHQFSTGWCVRARINWPHVSMKIPCDPFIRRHLLHLPSNISVFPKHISFARQLQRLLTGIKLQICPSLFLKGQIWWKRASFDFTF